MYACAIVGILGGLLYVVITRNDSPVTKLISVMVVFGGILLVTSVAGGVLGNIPQVQVVFCNPNLCERANLSRSLRETGKLDGAEDVSRTCIADISQKIIPEACEAECSRELTLALYEKAGQTLDVLPPSSGPNKQAMCTLAQGQLVEAGDLAKEYDYDDLAKSIDERQKRLEDKCAVVSLPTPPPPMITVDVLRFQKGENQAFVDIRVLQDGVFLPGLMASDFSLTVSGQPILFDLEERKADDPLCLIAVVDNSGSIYTGLDQIHAAIDKLNDLRKPGDELGLVVFDKRNHVSIAQYPSTDPLNPSLIQGNGSLTALWDGTLEGLKAAGECSVKNRYLLVLTDGKDNDSSRLEGDSLSRAHAIANLAAEQGVGICTVGVTDQVETDALKAVATGCNYYPAENFDAVASQFQTIFGYVRDFYRLSFDAKQLPANGEVILWVKAFQEATIDFTP